ncbi:MAG: DUF2249 domain-containing protein, partial [Lachnospiraceae bacterium]|nr:DUF2249 domain-containing protein [Lachnospiraceae bacterium]
MAFSDWKDRTAGFKKIDVRGEKGNFLPGIMKVAAAVPGGRGIDVIQTFEPVPLYGILENMGFEHYTERTDDGAYHAYFYRPGTVKEAEPEKAQPAAAGIEVISGDLGRAAAELRDVIWNDEGHFLPRDMRLLFAAVDAAGMGRMHHAAEELFEAYRNGLDIRAADDAFKVLIWDRG